MYETSIDLVLRIRCHVVFEVSDLLITAQQRKMNEDYSVLRLFYALTAAVDGHHPCLNCGVRRMPNGGVCSRCLGLPYCRNCKRHLSSNCFDNPNVCQVRFMHSSRFLASLAQLTNTAISYRLLSIRFRHASANEEDLASRVPSTTSSTKCSCLQVKKTRPSITFYIATQTKSTELSTSTWNVMGTSLVLPTFCSFHFFLFVYMAKLKLLLFFVCV